MPRRPDNGRGRGVTQHPGLKMGPAPTRTTSGASITDRGDQNRVRQIRRLVTIELTRILYGPSADLRPTPPGPYVCPPTCRYCTRRRVA